MAEEDTSDDISIAQDQAKILGLPKKIFFIVIAVIVALIISASAYFLLTGEDEHSDTEEQNTESSLHGLGSMLADPARNRGQNSSESSSSGQPNQSGQSGDNYELTTQIFELREQIIQLKEENLVLRKQIYDLETGNTPPLTQQQKLEANPVAEQPYKNPYSAEIKDYPPIEPYVPVDKPKPKFGNE